MWIESYNFYIGDDAFALGDDETYLYVGANFGSGTVTDAGLLKYSTTNGDLLVINQFTSMIIYGVSPNADDTIAYVVG